MIISHRHKFVFIKTRKTAGSTLESLLFPFLGEEDVCTGSARDGTPALNILEGSDGHAVPSPITGYFSFSIERNPWDKVVSSYFWHNQEVKGLLDVSFKDYIVKHKRYLPTDWGKYGGCDKVYLYEDMREMYKELNERFCLDIDISQLETVRLKSGTKRVADYRKMYNEDTKSIIADRFSNEIERFGYEF